MNPEVNKRVNIKTMMEFVESGYVFRGFVLTIK